jgi:hypothetical protein
MTYTIHASRTAEGHALPLPESYNHQILSIAAQPAPSKIAVQIYSQGVMTQMTVRHMQGEPLEKTLAWAEGEVEGYLRT